MRDFQNRLMGHWDRPSSFQSSQLGHLPLPVHDAIGNIIRRLDAMVRAWPMEGWSVSVVGRNAVKNGSTTNSIYDQFLCQNACIAIVASAHPELTFPQHRYFYLTPTLQLHQMATKIFNVFTEIFLPPLFYFHIGNNSLFKFGGNTLTFLLYNSLTAFVFVFFCGTCVFVNIHIYWE